MLDSQVSMCCHISDFLSSLVRPQPRLVYFSSSGWGSAAAAAAPFLRFFFFSSFCVSAMSESMLIRSTFSCSSSWLSILIAFTVGMA